MLKEKGAVEFNSESAQKLVDWLNKYEHLKVVVFGAFYDFDTVFKLWINGYQGCYDTVNPSRRRCAQKRMQRTGRRWGFRLNDALQWFGFPPREEGAKHDALEDARNTAKVWMEASKLLANNFWERDSQNEEED